MLNSPEFKQDVDKNAARKVINDMNREKKPITRELILSSLKSTCITKKLGWGIFYAFWCVLLVVCGFTGGLPTIIIFTVLGGGFTGWLAVDFIKTGIKYKKTLVNGKYRIIKAACTRIEDKSDDESDFYLCHFENGAAISGVLPVCVEGDYFYFVYPDGDKEHQLYYNALDYAPAPGLTYEDFNPAYSPIETR